MSRIKDLRDQRRFMIYAVNPEAILNLFNARNISVPAFHVPVFDGLPEDAYFSAASYDFMSDSLLFNVYHETFESVPKGYSAQIVYGEMRMVYYKEKKQISRIFSPLKSRDRRKKMEKEIRAYYQRSPDGKFYPAIACDGKGSSFLKGFDREEDAKIFVRGLEDGIQWARFIYLSKEEEKDGS